jgi:hypothetical protein
VNSGRDGYADGSRAIAPDQRGDDMPMWAWILLIVLLVLLVTGGIGYGRR